MMAKWKKLTVFIVLIFAAVGQSFQSFRAFRSLICGHAFAGGHAQTFSGQGGSGVAECGQYSVHFSTQTRSWYLIPKKKVHKLSKFEENCLQAKMIPLKYLLLIFPENFCILTIVGLGDAQWDWVSLGSHFFLLPFFGIHLPLRRLHLLHPRVAF